MNLWQPKTVKELKQDAKFSADLLSCEAESMFNNLESIRQFVENWESWLFTYCYFEQKNWFIELENKKVNISSVYSGTFQVYQTAKAFLKSVKLYVPYYYGFESMTAHYYNRGENENE